MVPAPSPSSDRAGIDAGFDVVCFDVGGTLVAPAAPGTAVADLEPVLLDGVARTLAALSGRVRLAAVTDTAVMVEADVRALLARAGIGGYLDAVVTSVDVGAAKPDPTSLQAAMARLGVEPSRVLFVGDADADEGAATAAGTAFARAGAGRTLHEVVRAAVACRAGHYAAAALLVAPLDGTAARRADEVQAGLAKPAGSLGRIEAVGRQLSAIAGCCPPPSPSPAAVGVFAGDHGVHARGVSPWPQEVTAAMVATFAAGAAAVNVFSRRAGAHVVVCDVGVATPVPEDPGTDGGSPLLSVPHRRDRRVAAGTADLSEGPAMTIDQARRALDAGAELAADLVEAGAACLATGDMGIANTTPAAALVAAYTGRPASAVTGRGTGIDDGTLAAKAALVGAAVSRTEGLDPLEVLAEVGGFEHAALAGFVTGAAAARVPVVIDGVIAGSALLAAVALCPGVQGYALAGHRSVEPGATALLDHLGLEPLLDLGLALGEGTGAVLALPLLDAAAAVLSEMASLDGAGISTG